MQKYSNKNAEKNSKQKLETKTIDRNCWMMRKGLEP